MKKAATLLLAFLTLPLYAQESEIEKNQTIKVEGTTLAQLQSVTEMFFMLPGVTVDENGITVIGRGTPHIYIDNRKISDLTELNQIKAEKVKEIVVFRHPGAEYDKNVESVIVVRMKRDETEGFMLDESLRFDLTHKLSTNNELNLGWKRKALTLRSLFVWNEDRREVERFLFTYKYKDKELISKDRSLLHPVFTRQRFTTRFSAAYDFNDTQNLTFNYALISKDRDNILQPESSSLASMPQKRHDFALLYSGKWGSWDFLLGNNSFIEHADQVMEMKNKSSYYLRKEYDLCTFAKLSRKIGNGTIVLGSEHMLDHMNVTMYNDDPQADPSVSQFDRSHAIITDNVIGVYASASQSWGKWNIEAGLRYENRYSDYVPCEDDGLMKYLDEIAFSLENELSEKYYRLPALAKERKITAGDNVFYPSIKISTQIGKSELSLKYTKSSIHPYLGFTRLRVSDLEFLNQKIVWAEMASSTTLEWKRQWLRMSASFSHYDDPICRTISSSTQYNAPDYDAIDMDITLTPKVGVWVPVFMARMHKQWFKMPLASGKDRLIRPYAYMSWNNTFTLAKNWTVRFNAQWHSRGAERNIYYFNKDLKLDASLQKDLPEQGLTLILSANNITRNSYIDQGMYVQDYYGVSQGLRERTARTISLTMRYKL